MKPLFAFLCVCLSVVVGCGEDQDSAQLTEAAIKLAAMTKAKDAAVEQIADLKYAASEADKRISGLSKELGAADLQLIENRETIEKLRQEIAGMKLRLADAEKAAKTKEHKAAGK